ncbi:unnamed protein product [Prorocentrum cordatum]|uniref:Uncharacterized protein n=1 Tax=Prorocentrum cordatum TaxID=2364126 RepID=A0ABN9WJX6_9DINO|nr:unnamed protein product [Polarella glacialis]
MRWTEAGDGSAQAGEELIGSALDPPPWRGRTRVPLHLRPAAPGDIPQRLATPTCQQYHEEEQEAQVVEGGWKMASRQSGGRKQGIYINFQSSARISRICAEAPSMARGAGGSASSRLFGGAQAVLPCSSSARLTCAALLFFGSLPRRGLGGACAGSPCRGALLAGPAPATPQGVPAARPPPRMLSREARFQRPRGRHGACEPPQTDRRRRRLAGVTASPAWVENRARLAEEPAAGAGRWGGGLADLGRAQAVKRNRRWEAAPQEPPTRPCGLCWTGALARHASLSGRRRKEEEEEEEAEREEKWKEWAAPQTLPTASCMPLNAAPCHQLCKRERLSARWPSHSSEGQEGRTNN